MYLMSSFNPKIDRLIDKVKSKFTKTRTLKVILIVSFTLMFIDFIVTGIALKCFQIRKIEEYNLNVDDREKVSEMYEKIYSNENIANFIHKYWGDAKMIRTFPNLKIQDKDGNMIYFDTLVPNVQPYYFMVYEKKY